MLKMSCSSFFPIVNENKVKWAEQLRVADFVYAATLEKIKNEIIKNNLFACIVFSNILLL